MKVLSNLEFKNSTYILNKFEDFPENPSEGTVIFKENGLYIYSTNISSGQLEWLNILDFTRTNTSYKFEQISENIEWNITHNLNTQDLFVIVYDSDGNKQVESEIQFQSDNEIKLIFSEPISGKALLFGASVISSPSNMYTKEEIDELLKNIEVSGGGSNIILPENGVDGYLLSKSGDELGWTNPADVGTKLPEDGLNGQVLTNIGNNQFAWKLTHAPSNLNVGDMFYTYADTPPANTLFCNSSLVSKNDYPELYSIIGDKFNSAGADDRFLMVPTWDLADEATVVSNITSDTSLGNDSYCSAILYGNIKVSSIGPNGGYFDSTTYAWNVFNSGHSGDTHVDKGSWHSIRASTGLLEFEFLDGTKFAPYRYGLLNRAYTAYYYTNWELLGWNDSTQEWDILDSHSDGSVSNPSQSNLTYYNISGYDNTKCYGKFRLSISGISMYAGISQLRIYGTKEGEESIKDFFTLPPSHEDTTGAKNCIVALSGSSSNIEQTEEQVIGIFNGKPLYKKIVTGILSTSNGTNIISNWFSGNIDKIVQLNGLIYNTTGQFVTIPFNVTSDNRVLLFIDSTYNINIVINHSSGIYNSQQIIIEVQYTKI